MMVSPGRIAGLFFSRFIPSVTILMVGMLFSRVLPPADYGVYTTLWVHLSVASVLTAWGFPSLVLSQSVRWTADRRTSLFRSASLLSALLALITGLTLYLAGGYPLPVSLLSAGLVLIQSWFAVLESRAIRANQEWSLQLINSVWSVGFLAVHILVWQTGYSLVNLLTGWMAVSGLRLMALSYLLGQIPDRAADQVTGTENVAGVWFGFGLNDALQIVSRWLDKLVVAVLVLPADFAVYFNGTFEIPFITMLMTSVAAVATSQMSESLHGHQTDPFRVFRITTRWTAGLVFPLFFFAFWQRDWVITLLFSETYAASAVLFGIYCWVLPVRIGSFSSLLQVRGDSRRLVTGAILDLALSLSLMFSLYPFLGLAGIALALVLSTWIQAGYYLVVTSRTASVPLTGLMDLKSLLQRFFLSGFLIGLMSLLTANTDSWLRMLPSLIAMSGLTIWFFRSDLKRNYQEV
ncbi:MAG: oligosaccharide flippase family protein [Bacteroidetes bacterium]|nr:oligosaccharide flippase family protein [Bacteroidota bacterium]